MNVPLSVIDSPTQVFCIYFYFMIISNNNLSEFSPKGATTLMIPYNVTHHVIVIRATYVQNTHLCRSMLLEECSCKVYQNSPCVKMIFYPKSVLAYIFLLVFFRFLGIYWNWVFHFILNKLSKTGSHSLQAFWGFSIHNFIWLRFSVSKAMCLYSSFIF